MSDDFMDLLGDEGAKPQDQGGAGGPGGGLGDLLGSLMGGGASGASGGDMSDLLGSLMGSPSAGTSGSQAGSPGGGMGDLLGGLLGGGGAGGLGGLLGGLMGGGSGQMTFGGGGGPSMPFASTLAEKLGISEQMASMLIMGAIGLLTSSLAKKRSSGRGEVAFNEVTDADYIRSSGIAGQLSSQMGISEDEAIHGLQQTMNLMAAGQSPESPVKKPPKKSAAKKTTSSSTKSTPKKKTTKKKPKSDFQDLLDDMTE